MKSHHIDVETKTDTFSLKYVPNMAVEILKEINNSHESNIVSANDVKNNIIRSEK